MRALFPLLLLLAAPAAAQEAPILPAALPAEAAEAILARPDRFADLAADLIHGHGQDSAITREAIETTIALDRAFFRTRALRPFLESDLDADGSVTPPELAARAATLSANGRARLMRQLSAADADADGALAPPELRAFAEAEVARASRPQDEALLRAVAAFDSDADGRTTLAELSRALGPLAAAD